MKKFITNTSEVVASGTPVLTKNLADMQDGGVEQIEDALTDLFLPGIIYTSSPLPFNITDNADGTFSVGQGVGYDNSGNRIEIASVDTTTFDATLPTQQTPDGIGGYVITPKSTGCRTIGSSISIGTTAWVGINFLHACDSGTPTSPTNYSNHPITGGRLFYAWKSGYQIQLYTSQNLVVGLVLGSIKKTTAVSYDLSQITSGRTYLSVNPLINTTATGVSPNSIATAMIQNSAVTSVKIDPSAVFQSGTCLPFYQPSAPLGWTPVNGLNDRALRVVLGQVYGGSTIGFTGGSFGGSVEFSTSLSHAHTTVASGTYTGTGSVPSSTYTALIPSSTYSTGGGTSGNPTSTFLAGGGGTEAGDGNHHHSIPALSIPTMSASIPAMSVSVPSLTIPALSMNNQLGQFAYADVIICSKN